MGILFWIAVAVLAAVVTFAIARPLLQESSASTDFADADLAVYKDQLIEIDADAARGAISATEADAARAEVSRRVLRNADGKPLANAATPTSEIVKPLHMATTLVLPLASLALYLVFGAPGLPGLPLSERVASSVDASRPEDMVAKVEARLRERPDDGMGWDVIAPVYMAQARYVDAAQAFASAIKILGETPARLLGFAEARIRADNGLVPDDARKALLTVLAKDPKRIEPRIWLAMAKEQDGKTAEAIADYRALLDEAPADAPWRRVVRQSLAALDKSSAVASDTNDQRPSDAAIAEAEGMSPEARAAMIDRMVNGLADKLKANGRDKDGWLKLIRAYQMLGRKDDAVKAVASAKIGLVGDDAAVTEIDAFAKLIGVGG